MTPTALGGKKEERKMCREARSRERDYLVLLWCWEDGSVYVKYLRVNLCKPL